MVKHGLKYIFFQMVQSGKKKIRKWSKLDQNGPKCINMFQNGSKWSNIV